MVSGREGWPFLTSCVSSQPDLRPLVAAKSGRSALSLRRGEPWGHIALIGRPRVIRRGPPSCTRSLFRVPGPLALVRHKHSSPSRMHMVSIDSISVYLAGTTYCGLFGLRINVKGLNSSSVSGPRTRIFIIRLASLACPTRCGRSFAFFTFVPFKLSRGPIEHTKDSRGL